MVQLPYLFSLGLALILFSFVVSTLVGFLLERILKATGLIWRVNVVGQITLAYTIVVYLGRMTYSKWLLEKISSNDQLLSIGCAASVLLFWLALLFLVVRPRLKKAPTTPTRPTQSTSIAMLVSIPLLILILVALNLVPSDRWFRTASETKLLAAKEVLKEKGIRAAFEKCKSEWPTDENEYLKCHFNIASRLVFTRKTKEACEKTIEEIQQASRDNEKRIKSLSRRCAEFKTS